MAAPPMPRRRCARWRGCTASRCRIRLSTALPPDWVRTCLPASSTGRRSGPGAATCSSRSTGWRERRCCASTRGWRCRPRRYSARGMGSTTGRSARGRCSNARSPGGTTSRRRPARSRRRLPASARCWMRRRACCSRACRDRERPALRCSTASRPAIPRRRMRLREAGGRWHAGCAERGFNATLKLFGFGTPDAVKSIASHRSEASNRAVHYRIGAMVRRPAQGFSQDAEADQ
ncbi:hypothetical protein SPHINGOT1_70043 [Sphingomonas sp. T1]|nr:hypothetical protein SPHINGOT1_70043 [Sphingomonas sp. T1]